MGLTAVPTALRGGVTKEPVLTAARASVVFPTTARVGTDVASTVRN